MDKLNYGDTIEFGIYDVDIEVRKINNVLPVRFDGIQNDYVVCSQGQATHMAIFMENNDGKRACILLDINCKNRYLLVDAIVG